ncbi:hypothetical protein BCV70DRAFT_46741 [Testicularia cyperi]|uniref:Uncharacterized protein n=1 Tax=Testicularia cyperi TaxID=1882483 RepID=A0A317XIK0_9BASI|nr:hypothetical protein BCV70DRAFT_46741 [Testicularia cyperi]
MRLIFLGSSCVMPHASCVVCFQLSGVHSALFGVQFGSGYSNIRYPTSSTFFIPSDIFPEKRGRERGERTSGGKASQKAFRVKNPTVNCAQGESSRVVDREALRPNYRIRLAQCPDAMMAWDGATLTLPLWPIRPTQDS